MDSITIDGMEEMEFRRSIEAMLRRGQVDDAVDRLKALLAEFAGEGGVLPERFLSVTATDIRLDGWEELGQKLNEYDRPEVPMSAISIDILDPQGVGVQPDAGGLLKPVMETSYFSDSAYPFSEAGRDDLLDGYSTYGCEWQGNFENVDTSISVEGIDDLYGATIGLENKVATSTKADISEIRAGSVGSCYIAVLIHQAIRNAAREHGLPRPICVLAGSNDAYPFFDAPAMTTEEYRAANGIVPDCLPDAASQFEDEFGEDAPPVAGGMASLEDLIGLGSRRKGKKPVLTIAPDEADTRESLETPGEATFEAEEREHIMPSIHLEGAGDSGDVRQTDNATGADMREATMADLRAREPDEPGGQFPPLPLDLDACDAAIPIDFAAMPRTTRIDFGNDSPTARIEFGAEQPQSPPDFDRDEEPAAIDLTAEDIVDAMAEALLDLGAYQPADRADYAPEPLYEQLASPSVGEDEADLSTPPLTEAERDEAHEWPSPVLPAFPSGESEERPSTIWPDDDDLSSSKPAGPWHASDEDHIEPPFELDGFAEARGSQAQFPAFEHDPVPREHIAASSQTARAAPAVARALATAPQRHSIRMIAASVTKEGNAARKVSAHSNPSLVLRTALWFGGACKWLWMRAFKR